MFKHFRITVMNKLDNINMYTLNKNLSVASLVMIIIGLFSIAIAFIFDNHAAWTNLLFNNYFFLGISIFAVFFIARVLKVHFQSCKAYIIINGTPKGQ
mgnify:CR=1 FL=1